MSELAVLFQRFDWLSLLDIGLVAFVFFCILYLVRGTQAMPLLRGMIILLVIIAVLGNTLNLPAFPGTSATPTNPARPPARHIAMILILPGSMPAARAADSLCPTARISKPKGPGFRT